MEKSIQNSLLFGLVVFLTSMSLVVMPSVFAESQQYLEEIPIIHGYDGSPLFITQAIKDGPIFVLTYNEDTGEAYYIRSNAEAYDFGVKGNSLYESYVKSELQYTELEMINAERDYYNAEAQTELVYLAIREGWIDDNASTYLVEEAERQQKMAKQLLESSAEKVDYMKRQLETVEGEPVKEKEKSEDIPVWEKSEFDFLNLEVEQGDPLVFTVDERDACTKKMHPGQHESFHWNMDLLTMGVPMNMDRTLCEGSYVMFVDFNENNQLDDGYELMWHPNYLTYDVMEMIDYHEGNYDGKLSSDDSIWSKVKVMDWMYNVITTESLGIQSFEYSGDTIVFSDGIGPGKYVNDSFRILSYHNEGVTFTNGYVKTTYAAVQSPLADCSIYDINYMVAEKELSEWNVDTAMDLYMKGLETCKKYNLNEDEYISHWVAGIASAYHRNGDWEQAKPYYEEALEMSPDRHFYLTDYAILLHQLGEDSTVTLPIVEKALEIAPEHGYAHTVKEIILS